MKRFILFLGLIVGITALFAQAGIYGYAFDQWNSDITQKIPGREDFVEIGAGHLFGLGIVDSGEILVWGPSWHNVVNNKPSGVGFLALDGGENHASALKTDGSLVSWGATWNGLSNAPAGNDFVKISVGNDFSLALKDNGELVFWGANTQGEDNIPASTYFKDMSAGYGFALGIAMDGSIKHWGKTAYKVNLVPAGNDFVKVYAGENHAIALREDGSAVGWGFGGNTAVELGSGYQMISVKKSTSIALRDDGSVIFWYTHSNSANILANWNTYELNNLDDGLVFTKIVAGGQSLLGLMYPLGETDADGDGVADAMDMFPNDPERAYVKYYPLNEPNGWGTLAFEDLWPEQGDYDFNDFVIDYRVKQVLNANYEIKDIEGDFLLRAVGALKKNGFAIEFPFAPFEIEGSITLVRDGEESQVQPVAAAGKSVLVLIANTANHISISGSENLWNTQMANPYYEPIPFSFKLTLENPVDESALPAYGFWNPYLMVDVNYIVGKEIHLPGYPPTALADESLFRTGDDDTNPETGKYYKTANNLPWAIDVPMSWKYPREHKQISETYFGFGPWAQSGGTVQVDWYIPTAGKYDPEKLYNK